MNLNLSIKTINNKPLNKSIHYRQDTIPVFVSINTDYLNFNVVSNTFKLELYNQHRNILLHTYNTTDFSKTLFTNNQYDLVLNIDGSDIADYFETLNLELRDNETKINYTFIAQLGIDRTMEEGYFSIK